MLWELTPEAKAQMAGRMTSGAAAKDHLPGTRDAFARLDLLEPVCERLGPEATL